MNSAQVVSGKTKGRTEAGSAAQVTQPDGEPDGATTEQPRILDLLLRIPIGNPDWEPSPQATVECGCERGRACPFWVVCSE